MKRIFTIPNCLTMFRIAGGGSLCFITPLCREFYVVYTLCGISDVLDGWIARLTNSVSDFGSRLDSIADLLLYTVLIVKLLPRLLQRLPGWIWYLAALALAVRLCAYWVAFCKYACFASQHTWGNKMTGLSIFLLPYLLGSTLLQPYALGVCTLALFSSAEELMIHLQSRTYHPERKALLGWKEEE